MDSRLGYSTNVDFSSLTLQCVRQNFDESWKIFTDVVMNPSFEPSDVELLRKRALSAIRQGRDNPDQYLQQLVTREFYTEHPYGIDVGGDEVTIGSLSAGDLRSRLQDRLTTSQLLLVVVGNVSRDDLEARVKSSFGTLARGTYVPTIPPPVHHQEPSIKIVRRVLPTNYIQGVFSAPAFGSPESFPMLVGRAILSKRLFEEVRTKRSLSYAPAAILGSNFSNYGSIYVTAVSPDTTIKVMMTELKRMQDEAVGAKELHDKTNEFLTQYYLRMETNQSQADALARYELCGAGFEEAARFLENVKKVTPLDIQRVCKEYMHNLQFVLIGNPVTIDLANFMY
jgi:predicted Zn-dependent peptidase